MATEEIVKGLFREAGSKGGIEYIYTLVRVTGITRQRDPLLDLRAILAKGSIALSDEEALSRYCAVANRDEPFVLIANLLRCKQGKPYDLSPFRSIVGRADSSNRSSPILIAKVQQLAKWAEEAGETALSAILTESYSQESLEACQDDSLHLPWQVRDALGKCESLLSILLEEYFAERIKFRDEPRFAKLAGFEVIELLVDDDSGLHGFRMHFSNGSSAKFDRTADSTDCINVMLQVPLTYFVGELEKLRSEWRVGEKRLYEVGLPGRYNVHGEWKPLVYPGDFQPLQKDAQAFSSDFDVQAVMFYMMCTGHRVIEFVVRSTIELPMVNVSFGQHFHLFKCPPPDDPLARSTSLTIYDGTFELTNSDADSIKSAIAMIGIAVNRMTYAYGGAATWRLKYVAALGSRSVATPSEDDLHVLDSLLRKFPETDDAIILDYAIDWYNRGRSERSVFSQFLGFYIALESVAMAVAEGAADLGLEYTRQTKQERDLSRKRCIADKHEELYTSDPIAFVSEAYFDCVVGLKQKTRRVTELVFGTEHKYLDQLFKKHDGFSLSDIRGKLAHGQFTLLDREHERLVRTRLPEIAQISREFLTRIIFLLKPADPLPQWSGRHHISMATSDPRMTLATTDLRMFPNTDWRIRSEWCE